MREVLGEQRVAFALVQALRLVATDQRFQRGLQFLISDLFVEATFHVLERIPELSRVSRPDLRLSNS